MSRAECRVDGCSHPRRTMGLCNKHYKRLRAHGDPLVVIKPMPPKGAANQYLRTAAAYVGDECLIWPFFRDKNGYGTLKHRGRTKTVSRIVCEMVNGVPDHVGLVAAHSCGNGALGCVAGSHISWKTQAENIKDTVAHGKVARGKRVGKKLSEADVLNIREMAKFTTQRKIARQYDMSASAISHIVLRDTWRHI